MDGEKSITASWQEYARGLAGGLLFSFPVLFTMEVWQAGYKSKPHQLIIGIIATFFLLMAYNRYAGMHPAVNWKSVAIESIEELGIGLLVSLGALLVIGQIKLGMSAEEVVGKIIVEAMFVSIGVSIGTAQLGEDAKDDTEKQQDKKAEKEKPEPPKRSEKMSVAALALCGSVVVAGNVAPTDEVIVIALAVKPYQLLIMAIISLLFSVLVTYFSQFKGDGNKERQDWVYHMLYDTSMSYMVGLLASAFMLWFFNRFDSLSFINIVAECIVLGIIASLGASAGRLLIK